MHVVEKGGQVILGTLCCLFWKTSARKDGLYVDKRKVGGDDTVKRAAMNEDSTVVKIDLQLDGPTDRRLLHIGNDLTSRRR